MEAIAMFKEKRRTLLICLLLLCGTLPACTVSSICRLFNNSSVPLEIVRTTINRQQERLIVHPGKNIELTDWISNEVLIKLGANDYNYQTVTPSPDYIVTSGFGPWVSRYFRMQIEPDGRIYLLSKEQVPPVTAFDVQPKGFPLVGRKIAR